MTAIRGARGALVGNYAALAVALVSQLVLLPLLLTRLGTVGTSFFVVLWSALNFAGTAVGWLSGGGTVMMTKAAADGDDVRLAALYRRFARGMGIGAIGGWVLLTLWSLGVRRWWLRDIAVGDLTQVHVAVQGAGFYMLTLYLHQADLALLTARLEQVNVALFRTALQVLMFAFGACGVIWGGGVGAMFVGYATAALLVSIAAHGLVRRTVWPRVQSGADHQSAPESGALSGFAAYSIVTSLLQYADTLVIAAFGGPGAVVLLAFVQRLPDAAVLLIGRSSETLGPYYTVMAAAPDRGALQRTYLTATRVVWRVAGVAGVGYAVFGRDVVQWWSAGRLELPPEWFFVASGVVLVGTIVNRNAGLLAYYSGAPTAATRLLTWELLLRVALALALVRHFGPTAPILAALAAQLAVLLAAYRRLERDLLPVAPREMLAGYVWPAVVTVAPVLLLMVSLRSVTTGAVRERGLALLGAALGAAVLLAFQERVLGRQVFRRRRA